VAAMPRIVELNVFACFNAKAALCPADVALLVDGLMRHSAATLTQLQLNENSISGKSASRLLLDDNRLGDVGAIAVARLVRGAARLRALVLDCAAIGAAGWRVVGEAVAQSSSLEMLSLSSSSVAGDAGAVAIAAALSASTSLQHIGLRRCEIDDAGAMALAAVLREQPSSSRLYLLDLSCNYIGDEGAAALVAALIHWSLSRSNNPRGIPPFRLKLLENVRLTAATYQRIHSGNLAAEQPWLRVELPARIRAR